MAKEVDINKVVCQHGQVDDFFGSPSPRSSSAWTWSGAVEQADDKGQLKTSVEGGPGQQLEAIAAELAANKCCGLCSERTNLVPGEGSPNAELVFVGEAPGADEDAQGRPFVGRAGKKLNEIIAAMGLRREDVFICNILKCRPPGNRDPKAQEIAACLPYLQKQLSVINPKVIVALGGHAAKTLLDTDQPIGKLRGRFHDYYFSDEKPPAKLMPTYHPAYLLRNYTVETRKKVWSDMQKVMQLLGLKGR